MQLKAYVHPLSAPSNKVLFTLHALEQTFERVQINLAKGEQGGHEFKALNPFGKVPAINDDGFVLYESSAIISYLARREKSDLYPSTYKQRAIVDQWCSFSAEMVQSALQRVFFNRVLAPGMGIPVDEKAVELGMRNLQAYFPVIDAHLDSQGYLCGEHLTLADLTLLSVLDPVEVSQINIESHAALCQWRKKVSSMEFYTKTHSHFGAGILDRQ